MHDVVVVGGGPAGSATALALKRRDARWRVALVEKTDDTGLRVGETLPPPAQRLLIELGVWGTFVRRVPLESSGTRAAWGSPHLHENPFVFSPYGRGWHVDRRDFDAMLVSEAERAGVDVVRADWPACRLPARFVVDATGRRSSVARARGARHLVFDRLVGVAAFLRLDPAAPPPDTYTAVEACRDGWWYTALLPEGRLVAIFMTDASRVRQVAWQSPEKWRALSAPAPYTAGRLAHGEIVGAPALCAAASQRLDACGGDGWLAVGDAAGTVDPLSSQGVMRALRSGINASRAIGHHLSGDPRPLTALIARFPGEYDAYLRTRAAYYSAEQRWPDSPFWRQRGEGERARHALRFYI